MAGLSPAAHGERGQLLLVGAFGLAVLLLVFAGTLNAVTVTETVATGGDRSPEARAVAALQDDVRDGVGGLLVRVNDDDAGYATTVDRLERRVANWSDAVARAHAPDATAVNVTVTGTTEGSRVHQSTTRPLTNASGVANWTLASDVDGIRRFSLTLDRDSLPAAACGGGDCYELVVAGAGGDALTLRANRSAVLVDGPAGSGRCDLDGATATVDVTAGTVDGRACAPLSFDGGPSAPYDVRYRRGASANGTYELVVTATAGEVADGDFNGTGAPSVDPAVYAATVEFDYRSARLSYANRLRVARGEPDG